MSPDAYALNEETKKLLAERDALKAENAELRQKISDMEEEQYNRMVERNLRDSE